MKKIKLCPVCALVSGAWLILSAGVAWEYIPSSPYSTFIALLMGGTVIGIAYQGEKKFIWAFKNQLKWKMLVIIMGIPLSYLAIVNIGKTIVVAEFMILIAIAYFFFMKKIVLDRPNKSDEEKIRRIEEEMKNCC